MKRFRCVPAKKRYGLRILNYTTKEPIAGAIIITDGNGSAISRSSSGGYTIIQESGIWTVTVEAYGYEPEKRDVKIDKGETISLDIELKPLADFDGDGNVDLTDAIIALKLMAGINMNGINRVDINGDRKIGLEEVIYIIEKVTGLRN